MFVIYEEYEVDGGFGDAIGRDRIVGIVASENDAKEYCEKFSCTHIYDRPYADLTRGTLKFREIPVVDLTREPEWFSAYGDRKDVPLTPYQQEKAAKYAAKNSCENCPYFWAEDGDKYSTCHYESLGTWDPAPCEQPENDPEDEPAFDEERW